MQNGHSSANHDLNIGLSGEDVGSRIIFDDDVLFSDTVEFDSTTQFDAAATFNNTADFNSTVDLDGPVNVSNHITLDNGTSSLIKSDLDTGSGSMIIAPLSSEAKISG